jgi:hypothetical protein
MYRIRMPIKARSYPEPCLSSNVQISKSSIDRAVVRAAGPPAIVVQAVPENSRRIESISSRYVQYLCDGLATQQAYPLLTSSCHGYRTDLVHFCILWDIYGRLDLPRQAAIDAPSIGWDADAVTAHDRFDAPRWASLTTISFESNIVALIILRLRAV